MKDQITGRRPTWNQTGGMGRTQWGVSPPFGGRGFPGESLIGTLLSGLYAARARADVCSVHRRRRQVLRRELSSSGGSVCRRSDFRISTKFTECSRAKQSRARRPRPPAARNHMPRFNALDVEPTRPTGRDALEGERGYAMMHPPTGGHAAPSLSAVPTSMPSALQ